MIILTLVSHIDSTGALACFPPSLSQDPSREAMAVLRGLGSPPGLCCRQVSDDYAAKPPTGPVMPDPVPFDTCPSCAKEFRRSGDLHCAECRAMTRRSRNRYRR